MELKKNPSSDLKRWSATFTNLGLVLSITFVLVAFEWKAYDDFQMKVITPSSQIWDSLEIPVTIQNPPPPPAQIPIELIIEPDDQQVDHSSLTIDIDYNPLTPLPDIVISDLPIIEKPDEIIDFVEKQASFKGGMEAWYAYLRKNLTYPSQARKMGIQGAVIVRFVVNTDGSIQDVEIVRGIGGGCDEIAKKVIVNSPNWNPGNSKGLPVRSRMTMPIRFRLD